MPVLKPGVPLTLDQPVLVVENKLSPGRYRFRLVAIDNAGLESEPAEMVVTVEAPVAEPVLRPDRVLRPDILTRPVVEPVARPVLRPGITNPIRRPN